MEKLDSTKHAFNYVRRLRGRMGKIESVPWIVKTKADALEFYTTTLGFDKKTDVTNDGYRWRTVGPKGCVECRRELPEHPGGVSATVSDPDGNLFIIRGVSRRES